ncbi:MAG: DUF4252 domain-containing protein [Calditrichaeota bacterium]|nr:MAG: DUF4252 domain-containing protein [Calditrichota bacterium]
MKQMRKTLRILLLVLPAVAIAMGARAQESENYKKHPGYVDLSFLKAFGEPESTVEIFLTPGLARLIGSMDEDKELQSVLEKLLMIKVYTFKTKPTNRQAFARKMRDVRQKLLDQHWVRFMNVKDRDSHTEVFIKETHKQIQGMTILSLGDREATFVNLVGMIDLESIGKLSKKYNIPELDSLKQKTK